MKSIYSVAVKMTSQEQCDRMMNLFKDKKIPYSEPFIFDVREPESNFVLYHQPFIHLRSSFSTNFNYLKRDEVDELEFLKLLNNHSGDF